MLPSVARGLPVLARFAGAGPAAVRVLHDRLVATVGTVREPHRMALLHQRAHGLVRESGFQIDLTAAFGPRPDAARAITATVVEVLPNGHLQVVGEKQVGVNQNVDVLKFTGTVDPRTIAPGNMVASTQVANVRVLSRGRGAQDDAQTFGWLSRFFLTLSPL